MAQGNRLWMLAIAALTFAPAPLLAAEKPAKATSPTKPAAGNSRTYDIHDEYKKARLREVLEMVRQEEATRRVMEDKKTREFEYAKEQYDAKQRTENGEDELAGEEAQEDGDVLAEDKAPEGAARADKVAVKAETQEEAPPPPDLVISYDKHYVGFDRQLRQLLLNSERGKRAAHYEIVSEVPANSMGGRRNYISNGKYDQNLQDLLRRFNELGVQASRITVSNRPSDGVTAQKVSIYEN